MSIKEVYINAGISPPTFYLHHRSIQEAIAEYESSLEDTLHERMPDQPKREVVYTILTSHIATHRGYFLATSQGRDYYLLDKIITFYRINLVGGKIDDRVFRYYVGTVIVAIDYWLRYDGITAKTTQACCERLNRIRPIKWD